jgi:hypothetical protein
MSQVPLYMYAPTKAVTEQDREREMSCALFT